jgi:hypothetical protein
MITSRIYSYNSATVTYLVVILKDNDVLTKKKKDNEASKWKKLNQSIHKFLGVLIIDMLIGSQINPLNY